MDNVSSLIERFTKRNYNLEIHNKVFNGGLLQEDKPIQFFLDLQTELKLELKKPFSFIERYKFLET